MLDWSRLKMPKEWVANMRAAHILWLRLRDRFSNLAGVNLELGAYHLAQGNLDDALLRYRIATWAAKANPAGWCGMGRAYAAKGEKEKARAALQKALTLAPAHEEALRALNELG